MESSNYKLSNFEAVCLMVIIMMNKLILNIPYYVISLVGTGVLVNLLYIGIIDFIFCILLLKLLEKFNFADLFDISEFLGGKILKWIFGITIIIMLFFSAFITLSNFSTSIQIVYFSRFSIIYILIFFLVGAFVCNMLGLKSISNIVTFLAPICILSIVIQIFGVWEDYSVEAFSPVFGHDFKTTFLYGLTNMFSVYVIGYYYFISPYIANKKDFKKIVKISYLICWLLLFLAVIPIMTLFNVNAENEPINVIYMLSRKIEFGNFIQRTDAIFMLLWLMAIMTYLGFAIFLINKIWQKLTNISDSQMLTFSSCSILFGLAILPVNSTILHFLEDYIYKYTILIAVFIIEFLILILAVIKKKHTSKLERTKSL